MPNKWYLTIKLRDWNFEKPGSGNRVLTVRREKPGPGIPVPGYIPVASKNREKGPENRETGLPDTFRSLISAYS